MFVSAPALVIALFRHVKNIEHVNSRGCHDSRFASRYSLILSLNLSTCVDANWHVWRKDNGMRYERFENVSQVIKVVT